MKKAEDHRPNTHHPPHMMQLTRFTLVAAAAFGNGALASSAPDIANEIRAGAAGFGAGAGAALFLDMRQSGKNLQTFSGALGGIKADAVSSYPTVCSYV